MSGPKVVVISDAGDRRILKTILKEVRAMNEKLDALDAAVADQATKTAALQETIDAFQERNAAAIAELQAMIAEQADIDPRLNSILEKLQANTAAIEAASTDVGDTPLPNVEG